MGADPERGRVDGVLSGEGDVHHHRITAPSLTEPYKQISHIRLFSLPSGPTICGKDQLRVGETRTSRASPALRATPPRRERRETAPSGSSVAGFVGSAICTGAARPGS